METPKQRFITLDIKTLAYLGDLMNTFERSVVNIINKVPKVPKSQKPVAQSPAGR